MFLVQRLTSSYSLAMIEMKVIITTLLRQFIIEVPPHENPEDMRPVFAAVIRPKAERCDLLFKEISTSS